MVWRNRGPVDRGECRLLAIDQDGLVCVRGQRGKGGGVVHDEVFYPDELLRDLGGGLYQLATALEVPADGNMAQAFAPLLPVTQVSQLEWVASWSSYDRARRRINWDELWARGGSTSNLIKNFILALVLVVGLFTGFAAFRASGSAADLAGQVADTRQTFNHAVQVLEDERRARASAAPAVVPTVVPSRP